MGKKGGWFSAIKRVFIPSSKEKLIQQGAAEKKNTKEKKKKGFGKSKNGEGRSFIPLFREPSSIEKILGEAERDPNQSAFDFRPLTPLGRPTAPSDAGTPRALTPQLPASPPRVSTSRRRDSPPNVLSLQKESPPTVSIFQRSSSPPRTWSPEIASPPPPPPPPPPKRSSSWKGPSKQAISTSQSFGSSTRSNASQRLDSQTFGSPPKGTVSQRLDLSPIGSAAPPQRVFSAPQRGVSPPPLLSNVGSSSRAAASSKISSGTKFIHQPRSEPTLNYQHVCATKIQTAYRGYTARRSYRALRGLVRLQAVVKGQNVKRQTVNAMKCMQLLVRVQTQIQSRRIQMLENQALQRQAMYKNATGSGKWMEKGQGNWDDSPLTKDEADARTNRKAEAVMKRERAMAYAYSNQLWKVTPRTAQAALMDLRSSGGYPWWWNWLDRHETPSTSQGTPGRTPARTPGKPFDTASSVSRNFNLTPPRSVFDPRASPSLVPSQTSNTGGAQPENFSGGLDSFGTPTPRSSRSTAPFRSKLAQTPPPAQRFGRMSRPGGSHSPFGGSIFKDDDSLTSCPPFSVPRYMEATASAKAKLRAGDVEDQQSRRRVSFPLGRHGVGSFKWNKRSGGLFSMGNASPSPSLTSKDAGSQRPLTRKPSMSSVGNASVDSTVSMPANVGRKPFNRFV